MDWKASWIWHPARDDMDDFYVHVRRAFELEAVPAEAVIHVTASSLYKLYVNGRFVGRGPNPSDPSRYYYDTYEVGALLRPGRNVVAALCYNYGPETRGILGQNWGRGGFLLELRAGPDAAETVLVTDGDWRALQATAWRQGAALNCTLYGDFKEIIDTRHEPEGWLETEFDDGDWLEPEVLGRPPVEPWTALVPREIPQLGGERVHPVDATWESASVTYSWREDYEAYGVESLVPGNPRAGKDTAARVLKTHDDFAPSIILDFGHVVTGYPEFTVEDSEGGVVDVLYGEDLYLVRVDTFALRGGRQVLRPYNRRTFRYVKLLFRETPDWVHVSDVSMEINAYPVERRGAFSCSDPLLNRIWEVGRHTIHMSMLDHFVDCPWRERTLYGGDMWAENLIAHYAFGDPRMNAKCLRQMAQIQFPEGALPPYGPYRGADGFYPAWSGYWGLNLLDHYEFTADRELLEELWPNLRRLLEWTIGQIDNEFSLIGRPSSLGKKADRPPDWDPLRAWTEAEKADYVAWDNFPFYPLLRRSAEAARALGLDDEAARYADAAGRMGAALREHMTDEAGLCKGAVSGGGGHSGQYHQAMLLWSGLPDGGRAAEVARRMLGPEVTPIGAPFHGLFVLDGLYRYGHDQRALDFTRQYWGDMLERGATTYWDNFSLSWPAGLMPARGTSLCHGWAAGPTYALGAYVLGVRPLSPGFQSILVEPRPGDLAWASGRVPTPHGEVAVRWGRADGLFELNVDVPAGTEARVAVPMRASAAGKIELDGRPVEAEREGQRAVVSVPEGRHRVRSR